MSALDTALAMAAVGIRVHPTRAKAPILPHPLESATTSRKTIAEWWTQYPDAIPGFYPGQNGLVVADVDEKPGKPSGSASLKADGCDLPKTWNYATPSGGRHYVYRVPEGVELSTRDGFLPGVDLRAGNGNVVCYAKSVKADRIATAPDWALAGAAPRTTSTARAAHVDLSDFLERCVSGEPLAETRDAAAAVDFPAGAAREPMRAVTSLLVKAGAAGEPGIPELLDETRERYVSGDAPERPRDWDLAVAGSVSHFGLPPVTFPLSKAEKKAIRRRNNPPATKKGGAVTGNAHEEIHVVANDDSALAVATAAGFRDSLSFVAGAWREYDGKRWASASDSRVVELVRAAHEERGMIAFRSNDTKLATWLVRRTTIEGTAKLIRGILERRAEDFDAYPDELNVANGIVDLRTGELRPHDPARLHSKVARASYQPGATHDDVTAALKALPREVREWMQIRVGQAATGHVPDDDVVIVAQGGGSNGKSTVNGALLGALGDYAAIMPEQLLLASQGDHPTALMDLLGLRLAITEELPEGHALNVKRLKDVAGTPRMKARRMRQDFVEWTPTHALFASSNYEPRVAETDHGTWRRLALVRFPYRYVNEPREADERPADARLRSRLGAGKGGRDEAVLAWVIEGAMRWYAGGMVMPGPPARVVADTEAWRAVSDTVFAFAEDRLVFGRDAHASTTELVSALNAWLVNNGRKSWSPETFASRFGAHDLFRANGVTKKRSRLPDGSRPNVWLGVGLRPNEAVLNSFARPSQSAHN